jgi:hypothetical protein
MEHDVRLMRIRLNLARTKHHPGGSARHGYEFIAPLKATGHIDPIAWKAQRSACFVKRFWGDEPVEHGLLVHRAGGAQGATWGFDYDRDTQSDDEAGYRFGEHAFRPGEYVSIRDDEDELHPFMIVEVVPA